MPKPYKVILVVSVFLSALCFLHDYLYDDPSSPYPIKEIITDIVLAGSMYTAIFFGIIGGAWYLASSDIFKIFRRSSKQ